MKKVIFGVLVLVLVIIILISKDYFAKKENDIVADEYYIYMLDTSEPGGSYLLEMDNSGKFSLEVKNFSSAVDVETSTEVYDFTFSEQEFSKVKKILNYIKNKYELDTKEDYLFYFDFEKNTGKLSYEDSHALLHTLMAIENIAMGDEMIDEKTSREFGNEWLDIIIDSLKI